MAVDVSGAEATLEVINSFQIKQHGKMIPEEGQAITQERLVIGNRLFTVPCQGDAQIEVLNPFRLHAQRNLMKQVGNRAADRIGPMAVNLSRPRFTTIHRIADDVTFDSATFFLLRPGDEQSAKAEFVGSQRAIEEGEFADLRFHFHRVTADIFEFIEDLGPFPLRKFVRSDFLDCHSMTNAIVGLPADPFKALSGERHGP